ncbi:MAG: HAD-IIA family hydrolase [Lachnospiraceae bacterium]
MYEQIKAVLFDLDGTIYYGSQLIEGADEVVQAFRDRGKKVFFLTNNSTKSREQICDKLRKMGLPCRKEEIYTSGYAAALYAKEKGYERVYIFGTDALRQEFAENGVFDSKEAQVVVIGYDAEFDYAKLTDALQAALHADTLIACNKEKHFPGEHAKRMPGCGAMVGALEGSLGRTVDDVVGKPNPLLLDIICKQQNLNKDEILMVGDTYESDIQMAKEYGCSSVYIGEEYVIGHQVSEIREILNWL